MNSYGRISAAVVGGLSAVFAVTLVAAQQPMSGTGPRQGSPTDGMSQHDRTQVGQESHGGQGNQPNEAGSQGKQGMQRPGTPIEKDVRGGDKLGDDTKKQK
jgi:hypothetical protein